jgi:precorrin-6A synthase
MRKIMIIGIGAGNPEHITIQAINALGRMDVLFLTDKGREKEDLLRLRREICRRYVPQRVFRVIEIQDPARDRDPADYLVAVATWHEQRAALYERVFCEQLGENECGAFLVWGDPSLYDSTLRIVGRIAERAQVAFEYEVIPGISSIQALTARHRIALNRIGEPVRITTGRKLAADPVVDTDTVVLLDAECAFKHVATENTWIYWGAYLGTPQEIALCGPLGELAATIERVRSEARQRAGWIMDTYLLTKSAPGGDN